MEYLRGYVQGDRVEMLAIAEFVGNNQVSASTGASHFPATTGRNPGWDKS